MYRVEWMKKGWKTLFWDCFSRMDLATRFMEELKGDENVTVLVIVTPWDTLWF